MFKNLEKTINITGYNTQHTLAEKMFSATFRCCNCKHIQECADVEKCTFVKYIQDRITDTVYECKTVNPQLTIILNNPDACQKAMRTIIRAKKLRSYSKDR